MERLILKGEEKAKEEELAVSRDRRSIEPRREMKSRKSEGVNGINGIKSSNSSRKLSSSENYGNSPAVMKREISANMMTNQQSEISSNDLNSLNTTTTNNPNSTSTTTNSTTSTSANQKSLKESKIAVRGKKTTSSSKLNEKKVSSNTLTATNTTTTATSTPSTSPSTIVSPSTISKTNSNKLEPSPLRLDLLNPENHPVLKDTLSLVVEVGDGIIGDNEENDEDNNNNNNNNNNDNGNDNVDEMNNQESQDDDEEEEEVSLIITPRQIEIDENEDFFAGMNRNRESLLRASHDLNDKEIPHSPTKMTKRLSHSGFPNNKEEPMSAASSSYLIENILAGSRENLLPSFGHMSNDKEKSTQDPVLEGVSQMLTILKQHVQKTK